MVGTMLDKVTMIRDPLKMQAAPKDERCWKQIYTKVLVFLFAIVSYGSAGNPGGCGTFFLRPQVRQMLRY